MSALSIKLMDNAIQAPANVMSAALRRVTCEDRRRLSGLGSTTGLGYHREDRARIFIIPAAQSAAFFSMDTGENSKAWDVYACVRPAVGFHSRFC